MYFLAVNLKERSARRVPHEGTAVVRLKLRVFCELVAKEGELNQHRGAL